MDIPLANRTREQQEEAADLQRRLSEARKSLIRGSNETYEDAIARLSSRGLEQLQSELTAPQLEIWNRVDTSRMFALSWMPRGVMMRDPRGRIVRTAAND